MKLLLDIGNTRVKWANLQEGVLSAQQAAAHNGHLSEFADRYLSAMSAPESVVAATGLAAPAGSQLQQWVSEHWACPVVFLTTPQEACGVTNAYARPSDLGIDRWLDLLACHHFVKNDACVIDCGTALTVDAIRADGTHLGGCIVPGLAMMRASLNQTGQINITDHNLNDLSSVNTSTKAGVYCGTLYAAIKAVDAIVAEMKKVLAADMQCIITGGEAEVIRPLLAVKTVYEKDWSLKGMMIAVSQC